MYSSAPFLLGGRAAGGICWRRSPGGGGVLPSSRGTGGRLGGGTEYGKSGTLAAAAASDSPGSDGRADTARLKTKENSFLFYSVGYFYLHNFFKFYRKIRSLFA